MAKKNGFKKKLNRMLESLNKRALSTLDSVGDVVCNSAKATKKAVKNNAHAAIGALTLVALLGAASTTTPMLHKQFLYHKVGRVTVKALIGEGGKRGGGTGFYVKAPSGKSYILTNSHICEEAVNNTVFIKHETGPYPERYVPRQVIETNPSKDLCLVEGYGDSEGISLASSGAEVQDSIYIIGHPKLMKLRISSGSVMDDTYAVETLQQQNGTKESCEAMGKNFRYEAINDPFVNLFLGISSICIRTIEAYQSDASAMPGNSGSPVVNAYGNLVGVLFAGDESGFSYILKYESIKDFLSVY